MQLLLGIVMFTICLFMFTTVLVYHSYFAIMNFLADLCVCGLWWYGFMVIEGVMQYDQIVIEEKKRQRTADISWKGREMEFHPVQLDNLHFGGLLEKFGTQPQECIKDLFFNVSISSKTTTTVKAVFPSKSDSSITINCVCAFIASRTRVTAFCQKLLFGSTCPISFSFVNICRTKRKRS